MPFLRSIISNKNQEILDACSGLGVESIGLAENEYTNVTANEVDPNFLEELKKRAGQQNVNLNTTNYNWLELEDSFGKNVFDIVLCFGNSFGYLFEDKSRQKGMKNFYNILSPGGKLIIDERNYAPTKKKVLEIMRQGRSPSQADFSGNSKPMYYGERVAGYPIQINEDSNTIIYQYEYLKDLVKDNPNLGNIRAQLEMYLFEPGELFDLLLRTGFKKEKITTFSDLQKEKNDGANFFQYVCEK